MVACELSSLILVKSFGPSCRIVSGRSKGSRSYIRPPGKWQGWHRDSSIGLMSRAKSTGVIACAGAGAGDGAPDAADGVAAAGVEAGGGVACPEGFSPVGRAHPAQSTAARAIRRSI